MSKELTWAEAINKVLGSSPTPLHYKEITDRIIADGLRKSLGATPAEHLRNWAGPEERVRIHSQDSGPLMEGILRYFQDNLAKNDVEPNSTLVKP